MGKRLTYVDAVRLLGGAGSGVAVADLALGGALLAGTAAGVPGVLGLFGAKSELIRVGRVLVGGLGDRVRGSGRLDRTARLHAAHAVIVVTAYFEAFDLVDADLTREDQLRLAGAGAGAGEGAGGWIGDLLAVEVPTPAPEAPYEVLLRQLNGWYADLSRRFAAFLAGLAVWDSLDDGARARVAEGLLERVPGAAVRRYEVLQRRLAAEVIEFRLWTRAVDDQATRDGVRAVTRGLQDLEVLLREAVSTREPERHRAALIAWHRAELEEPVLADEGLQHGVRMPALGEIYIDPVFRARPGGPGDLPSAEEWWADPEVRDDLPSFLAGYLTSAGATVAPLLVLGQPGAGKSALTRVIAARLPAADFVPVRVPLREVPADAALQDQIEHALRAATGQVITWPALVTGDEGGALPVLLLDGFDELLQATGVSRSDFLEQIAAFQRREAVQRRPVAVIVTSRIAVADRARLPPDSTVLRLEPFTPAQVARWLSVWSDANTAILAGHGLTVLPAEVANTFPDLAGQPLLLLMLALYDAEANEVQAMGEERLDAANLYERLLRSYAAREVRKSTDDATEALVESELQRLSVAAFAMFNRGQQWVTAPELDADLTALGIGPDRPAVAGFRAPLTPGQELLGRFFFIQDAGTVSGCKRTSSCTPLSVSS
ncbi:NACHT domain-containing protein [Mangrovihabitans endophyticus]|nr:NACHT domain-containing protein [Mangrovihabitans endophyticus]